MSAEEKEPESVIRIAPTTTNAQGEIVINWTLTPAALKDPVFITMPPSYTIPVIFVPGVMGSNLKLIGRAGDKKSGDPVWLYDNSTDLAKKWFLKTPEERQRLLNPENTAVYSGGYVPQNIREVGNEDVLREQRFWGEVGAGSYMGFLVWLENTLNSFMGRRSHGEFENQEFSLSWGALKNFLPLTKKELSHAGKIRFPVYACGYNWLQSNLSSAKALKKRIDAVIKHNNNQSVKCDKVILVTHSMGGLVARACSELLGASDKIAGIVHAAMPTAGAAIAYKRVRCGAEGSAGFFVLGDDAAKVSAVFANAPGPLQLLPSHLYPPGWLKIGIGSGDKFNPLFSLPKADPYAEIYAQRGKWWELMREELINPAEIHDNLGWKDYLSNLDQAQKFHTQLGNKYHKNTFTIHGIGTQDSERTWENVRWECSHAYSLYHPYSPRITMQLTTEIVKNAVTLFSDNGQGNITAAQGLKGYAFQMSGKDSNGDGTVPQRSGQMPNAHSRQSYAMNGFEHEGAFNNQSVRDATLHSILHIASAMQVR